MVTPTKTPQFPWETLDKWNDGWQFTPKVVRSVRMKGPTSKGQGKSSSAGFIITQVLEYVFEYSRKDFRNLQAVMHPWQLRTRAREALFTLFELVKRCGVELGTLRRGGRREERSWV